MTIQTSLKIIAGLSFSVTLLSASTGLLLTAPGSAIPGQPLAVTVTPTGTFSQVVVVGSGPIGYSSILAVTPSTATPYQFSLPIPATISPGNYSLTAMGVSSGGNATSTPVTISVARTDAPVEIDVTPSTLYLPVGARNPLRVIATYSDGTQLDITHAPGTTYSSTLPAVDSVDAQGNVTALASSPIVYGQLQLARVSVNGVVNVPVFTPPVFAVSPQWPILYASQNAQFSAFEAGMAPVQVRWTINPQIGSIDNTGLYTAPRTIPSGGESVTITATSRNNPSVQVSTGVALYPPVTIAIYPGPTLTLLQGQTQQFSQSVGNALDEGVDWSISPKGLGTISSTGLYTAPATVAKQETVTVTAISVADQSQKASTTVTLQP